MKLKASVERVRDTNDERNVMVRVTKEGYELKSKVRNVPEKILLETGVPPEEANNILELLKSILVKVNSQGNPK